MNDHRDVMRVLGGLLLPLGLLVWRNAQMRRRLGEVPDASHYQDTRTVIKLIHSRDPGFLRIASDAATKARDEELRSWNELEGKALSLVTILGVLMVVLLAATGAWITVVEDRDQTWHLIEWGAATFLFASASCAFAALRAALNALQVGKRSLINPHRYLEFQDGPLDEVLRHQIASLLVSQSVNYQHNNLKAAHLSEGYQRVKWMMGTLTVGFMLLGVAFLLSDPLPAP